MLISFCLEQGMHYTAGPFPQVSQRLPGTPTLCSARSRQGPKRNLVTWFSRLLNACMVCKEAQRGVGGPLLGNAEGKRRRWRQLDSAERLSQATEGMQGQVGVGGGREGSQEQGTRGKNLELGGGWGWVRALMGAVRPIPTRDEVRGKKEAGSEPLTASGVGLQHCAAPRRVPGDFYGNLPPAEGRFWKTHTGQRQHQGALWNAVRLCF